MELLQQFLTVLQAQNPAPSKATVKNYKADIAKFIRWFEKQYNAAFTPAQVTSETLAIYQDHSTKRRESENGKNLDIAGQTVQESVLALKSFDRHLSSLRKFFTFLKVAGHIQASPFEKMAATAQVSQQDPWRLDDFKNHLYIFNASDLTIKNYIIDVKQFLSWMEVVLGETTMTTHNTFAQISSRLINEYKHRLHEELGLSPLSVNRKLSSLRRFIHWATEEGYIKTAQNITIPTNGIQELGEQKTPNPFENIEMLTPITEANQPGDTPEIGTKNNEALTPLTARKSSLLQPIRVFGNFSKAPLRILQRAGAIFSLGLEAVLIAPLAALAIKAHLFRWHLTAGSVFTKSAAKASTGLLGSLLNTLNGQEVHNPLGIVKVQNFKKEFYAPLSISTAGMPIHKKAWHHMRHTRPNWYREYHKNPIVHYFHFAILIVVMTSLGFGMYQSFFNDPTLKRASAAPTAPPRILSFQGRLTDSSDNPITAATQLRFMIYNDASSSGSARLWEEVRTVTPDTDGIFSILLGSDPSGSGANASLCNGGAPTSSPATGACGIPQSLFGDNPALWLAITVQQTPELTPRQQIATVPYATNSELLQGMAPITNAGGATTNVVLALNSSGNLAIGGSATPVFQATGGSFTIQGTSTILSTTLGSNGNVILNPDGYGKIELQKPLQNSSNSNNISTAIGAVEVDDLFAVLATSSGQSAFTVNQDGSGPIISASSSGTAKFTVANSGQITDAAYTTAGGLLYGTATGLIAQTGVGISGQCLTTNGTTPSFTNCSSYWNQTNGALYPQNSTVDLLIGGVSTASAKFAVLNVNSGTPTASISAGINGTGMYMTSDGTLATTNKQTLTLGASTTGNINLGTDTNARILTMGNGTGASGTRINTGTGNFAINTNQLFVQQSDGNVGIGTTTPGQKLDLQAADSGILLNIQNTSSTGARYPGVLVQNYTGGFGGGPSFSGLAARGSVGSPAPVQSGDILFLLSGNGATNTSYASATGAQIQMNAVETFSPTTTGADLRFLTTQASTALLQTRLIITDTGNVGIGTTTTTALLDVAGAASVSGTLSFRNGAASVVATQNNDLTIGNSTTGKVIINPSGNIGLGTTTTSGFKIQAAGSIGPTVTNTYDLGSPSLQWNNIYANNLYSNGTLLSNYWTQANGAIYPTNTTTDLLVGGTSTASAKFAVINVVGPGSPTASVSAGTTGASYLTASGNLATTALQTLSLGGATTGNITLSPNNGSGTVLSTGTLNLSNTKTYQINGTDVLSSTTLGTGVVTSSLTTVGALASGSIASGFGTIATSNTITGTTINGTTGINTGASAGTQRIDSSGNLKNIGTTQLNGVTYTWPGADGSSGYVLTTNGSQVLSWAAASGLGTNYWTQSNGSLYPQNSTVDFFIGGVSTVSAKFAVLNVNANTPIASIAGNISLGGPGSTTRTIGATAMNKLQLGDATTGDLLFAPSNSVALTMKVGGNIGVGTVAPTALLDIAGAASVSGTLSFRNAAAVIAATQNNDLTIGNTETGKIILNPNGNIGIGLTNPSQKLDILGNIKVSGTTTFGSIAYTWPGSQSSGYVLSTNGSGILSWIDPSSAANGLNYWTIANGSIYPQNATLDLLIGGTSTASARFAILNVDTNAPGKPTASVSAGLTGGAYLTADGILATTAKQSFTLGATTTGNILIGTDATARTITIGNATGASGTRINTGTGNFAVNTSQLFVQQSDGNVGIGLTTPAAKLDIQALTSQSSGTYIALQNIASQNAGSTGSLVGFYNRPTFETTGTLDTLQGIQSNPANHSSGTVTNMYGIMSIAAKESTGPVTSAFGLYSRVDNTNASGAITNAYALFLADSAETGTITNDYGVYQVDTGAYNYFGGNVGVGITAPSSFTLQVAGNIGPNADKTYDLGASPSGRFRSVYTGPGSLHVICTTGDGCGQGVDYELGVLSTGGGKDTFIIGANGNSTNRNPLLAITEGGNVGIGLINPAEKLDVAGNLKISGTTNFGGVAYTWPGGVTNGYILQTNGSGTLSWVDPTIVSGATNYWNQANGTLYPKIVTQDLLIGGVSTASARFAFINMNSGTPTASISGNLALAVPTGANPATTYGVLNGGTINFQRSPGGDAGLTSSLFINRDGNVGIGTTAPLATLSLGSNVGKKLLLSDSGTLSTSTGFGIQTNLFEIIGADTNAAYTFGYGTSGSLTRLATLTGTGSFGIGTTNPLATLDVRGNLGTTPVASFAARSNAFAGVVVDNSGTGDIFTASASGLARFVITNNGNVGIGTTTPTLAQLQVGAPSGNGSIATNVYYDVDNTAFFLDPAATATSLAVAGNVGIGTTAPTAMLHIAGSGGIYNTNPKDLFKIVNTDATAASNSAQMSFYANRNGGVLTALASISAVLADNTGLGYNGDLIFSTARVANVPMERMRINGFGNVGIGTATAAARLEINQDTNTPTLILSSAVAPRLDFVDNYPDANVRSWSFRTDTTVFGDFALLQSTSRGTSPTTSRLYIKNDGNIGIGTTTPTVKLDVAGSASISAGNLFVYPTNGTNGRVGIWATSLVRELNIGGPVNSQALIRMQSCNSTCAGSRSWDMGIGNDGNSTQQFAFRVEDTGSSNTGLRLLYDSSGNGVTMGLGTTSPNASFVISQGGGTTTGAISLTASTVLQGGSIFLKDTGVSGGNGGAVLFGAGQVNSVVVNTLDTAFAGIKGYLTANAGAGQQTTGDLLFSTRNAVTDAALTERMRILANGNVGIGITNPGSLLNISGTGSPIVRLNSTSSNNPSFELVSNGATGAMNIQGATQMTLSYSPNAPMYFQTNGTTAVTILGNGNVGIGSSATTPATKLDIAEGTSANNTKGIRLVADSADFRMYAESAVTGAGDIGTFSNHRMRLYTNSTERMQIDANGNVGVGVTPGTAILQSKGTNTSSSNYSFYTENSANNVLMSARNDGLVSVWLQTTTGTNAICENGANGSNATIGLSDCNGSASDLAETYGTSDTSIEAGDLVIADGEAQMVLDPFEHKPSTKANVLKTNQPYQGDLIGVVSTNPNQVFAAELYQPSENPRDIAMVGRVPVKVSSENGPIRVGDFLTSSSTPGVAMKSTKPGPVIGKALNSYNGSGVGKIIVFVKPTFADPNHSLNLADVDMNGTTTIANLGIKDLNSLALLNQAQNLGLSNLASVQNLAQSPTNGNLTDAMNTVIAVLGAQNTNAAAMTNLNLSTSGNLAIITTPDPLRYEVTKDGNLLTQIGAFSQAFIANLTVGSLNVKSIQIGGQTLQNYIIAVVQNAGFNNTNNLIAPIAQINRVYTNTISPLANTGKVTVDANLEVAGSATIGGTLTASKIESQDGVFNGTLRAKNIIADNIEGLQATIATLAAHTVNNITNVYQSTPSGSIYASEDATHSALMASLGLLDQQNTYASASSTLNLTTIAADFGQFNQGLMALGPSSFTDVSVAGQFSVGGSMIFDNNGINTLGSDLALQPLRQGGISIMAELIHIDTDGNTTFGADVTFNQNIRINGKIIGRIISPIPDEDLVIALGNDAMPTSSKFVIRNSSGSAVLAVNQQGDVTASGSGTFSKLNLSLIRQAVATGAGDLIAFGSAGVASISATRSEITIHNANVTKDSLIYITPVGTSSAQGTYLLRQAPGDSFTVGGIAGAIFNWLIVN